MWTIFQLNSRQSGRHIAEEAKDKKEGNNGGDEETAESALSFQQSQNDQAFFHVVHC